jgi:hypothetical protein
MSSAHLGFSFHKGQEVLLILNSLYVLYRTERTMKTLSCAHLEISLRKRTRKQKNLGDTRI